jgi:hypothetical protein
MMHGADAPWTIGWGVSKDCVRKLNEHVVEFYGATAIGTKVTVTWERFARPVADRARDSRPGFSLFSSKWESQEDNHAMRG